MFSAGLYDQACTEPSLDTYPKVKSGNEDAGNQSMSAHFLCVKVTVFGVEITLHLKRLYLFPTQTLITAETTYLRNPTSGWELGCCSF